MKDCPTCNSNKYKYLRIGFLFQCLDCETIYGSCSKKQKHKIINNRISKTPKINSNCRYYLIDCYENGKVTTYRGWYDFENEEIAALTIENGSKNE